jgi:DivIVA domain-containing protein
MARLRDVVGEPFDEESMAQFVELAPAVSFRTSWNGYDRDQVDSFRVDVEQELQTAWMDAVRRQAGNAWGPPVGPRLAGHNLREMRFPRAMRGYDTTEVDTYLDCAAAVLTYLSRW